MKTRIILTLLLLTFGFTMTYSQKRRAAEPVEEDEVFVRVDKQPEFPGGQTALERYIKNNLRKPPTAPEHNIQGRVVCRFIVNKDGTVSDIEVVRSNNPALNEEALRVLEYMPNWEPGLLNGEPVRAWCTVPVNFNLP